MAATAPINVTTAAATRLIGIDPAYRKESTHRFRTTRMTRTTPFAVKAFKLIQPAFLSGFLAGDWFRLLRENGFGVEARYLPRAAFATIGTIITTAIRPFEPRAVLDEDGTNLCARPIFVLGLPRSGTTHLFNLLARDSRFAFPTRFDCYNAHTFLTLRRLGVHRALGLIPVHKRFMDDVKTGWLSPEEDNVALTVLAGGGSLLPHVFPSNERYWREFTGAAELPENRRVAFRAAIDLFARKLVYLHHKRPLFKSPAHTRSVADILQVFPEARFVTILRHPVRQFQSFAAMHRSAARDWTALQQPRDISDSVRLAWISNMLDSYWRARPTIPAGHVVEIQYGDLVQHPRQTLERIYSTLGLDCDGTRDELPPRNDYRTNRYTELSADLKAAIADVYRPFKELGFYETDI